MSRTYSSSFLLLLLSFINSFLPTVYATPCIAFDANFNLLAFGFGGKDYSVGAQDTWASATPADITATGRPPFDGSSPQCYLAQFFNAIYIIGADSANPASVYIYDATSKSWSAQSTTVGTFDVASYNAILDHDTNIFYAVSKGQLFSLVMGALAKANTTAIPWIDQKAVGFNTEGYQPVMALAKNHIHFLNVPGTAAGSANIFVIHFSYFQPEIQPFGDFPAQHGQVASFFKPEGAQLEFAYIPDDGSATYVINVDSNTTQTLSGPTTKDSSATYFAGITSLVQLSSSGAVSYMPYSADSASANTAAAWTKIAAFDSIAVTGSSSASGTGTGKPTGSSSAGSTGTGRPTGTSSGSSPQPTTSGQSGSGNGAVTIGIESMGVGLVVAVMTMFTASLL